MSRVGEHVTHDQGHEGWQTVYSMTDITLNQTKKVILIMVYSDQNDFLVRFKVIYIKPTIKMTTDTEQAFNIVHLMRNRLR